jgi:8-oxo-dGTP diphosphatase
MPFTYKYPHPAVCVDIILFLKCKTENKILLINRNNPPFENYWALPGGFVEINETLEQSAIRELMEETGIELKNLIQFATYGDPDRDPRERTVSIVYFQILEKETKPLAGDDAKNAEWFSLKDLPSLAFDHKIIIKDFINYKNL